MRKMKYRELRAAGQSHKRARRFRDWTANKVEMICAGIAVPI